MAELKALDARIPAHIEASALIRRTQAEGGFAAVLKKGHEMAGTLLIVLTENGTKTAAYERMPQANGSCEWVAIRKEEPENKKEFQEYLDRRSRQDDDLWIVELDSAEGERLIGIIGNRD
jgi:hypothetical protein